MTDDQDKIAARALELWLERAAGFRHGAMLDGFPAYLVRKAVTGIAAGGERAALAQIIAMVADSPAAVTALTDLGMDVIQQARHAQFPGNTGWTWDEHSQRWFAARGGIWVTAAFPQDSPPPVRADWFAVMRTGEPWHGLSVYKIMDNPGEKNMPWGSPVLAEIPEEFWTDDWCRGLRFRIYLGNVCDHSGPEARVCIQPRRENQGEGMEAHCVPFDPDHVRLVVLNGKLSDYQ